MVQVPGQGPLPGDEGDIEALLPDFEDSKWLPNDNLAPSILDYSIDEWMPLDSDLPKLGHVANTNLISNSTNFARPTCDLPETDLGVPPQVDHHIQSPKLPSRLVYDDSASTGIRTDKSGAGHKRSARLPQPAVNVLKAWFESHRVDPYPNEDEKRRLEEQTALTRNQITIWLANKRRRDGPSSVLVPPSVAAQRGLTRGSGAYMQTISNLLETPYEHLNPLDRWKIASPDTEAARAEYIARAIARTTEAATQEDACVSAFAAAPSELEYPSTYSNSDYSALYAPSLPSHDTDLTSVLMGPPHSVGASSSRQSCPSSQSRPLSSQKRRERRRRSNAPSSATEDTSTDRPYQCTFCRDHAFKTKHDWQRHENAVHLGLDTWTCCPFGGSVNSAIGRFCAFCDELEPDANHLESHKYSACDGKPEAERTFFRKDHFSQHLRVVHQCKMDAKIEQRAKVNMSDVRSTCGFCGTGLGTWSERTDHLAAHFRVGARMTDWRGGWGFEPQVQALVERASLPDCTLPVLPDTEFKRCQLR